MDAHRVEIMRHIGVGGTTCPCCNTLRDTHAVKALSHRRARRALAESDRALVIEALADAGGADVFGPVARVTARSSCRVALGDHPGAAALRALV